MLPLQPMSPFHVPPWKALFGWKASLESCVWLVTDLVTSPKSSPKASARAMLAVDAKGLLPSYRPFVPSNSLVLAFCWQPCGNLYFGNRAFCGYRNGYRAWILPFGVQSRHVTSRLKPAISCVPYQGFAYQPHLAHHGFALTPSLTTPR